MAVVPLSKDEIQKMKKVCRLAADTLVYVEKYLKPGLTTAEIDKLIYDYTLTNGAVPATLGYHGFPASCCTSINEVVCHGVPGADVLKEGDIINVDVTSKLDGFFGDTSKTFLIGKVSDVAKDVVEVARMGMEKGIEAVRPNGYTGDIGFETQKFVTRRGYTTVKDIGGHGIGRVFHTEPFVPSWGKKGKGQRLVPFTCFTVEPMINEGTDEILEYDIAGSSHKWYATADKKLSAQFEHTILVTDTGYEILTLS